MKDLIVERGLSLFVKKNKSLDVLVRRQFETILDVRWKEVSRMRHIIDSVFSKRFDRRQKEAGLPAWFVPNSPFLRRDFEPNTFLYQSWIPEHTDKLISLLQWSPDHMIDLNMFRDAKNKMVRREILRYAENNFQLFRRMALHKLSLYRGKVAGLIVTLDWIPAMRHLVYAAAQLDIPTILIPHESVFAKRAMYYVHPKLGIQLPACDIICSWGQLQESIFIERGYPAERIIRTGAPKFDYIDQARKAPDRAALKLVGLSPALPVLTFVAQPLDSQLDQAAARRAQEAAFLSLLDWVSGRSNIQLLLRMPPSRDEVFTSEVYQRLGKVPNVAVDDSNIYLLTSEETIEASDIVVSINSTMLLEAALCGKVAISSKFIEFDQIWDSLSIPVAHNPDELHTILNRAMWDGSAIVDRYNVQWAADTFSVGSFDGGASQRIGKVLSKVASGSIPGSAGFARIVPFAPEG